MSFIHPLVRGPLQSLQSLKNEKERYVTMAVEKLSSMQRLNPQFLQQIRDRKSAIVSNVLDGKEPSHSSPICNGIPSSMLQRRVNKPLPGFIPSSTDRALVWEAVQALGKVIYDVIALGLAMVGFPGLSTLVDRSAFLYNIKTDGLVCLLNRNENQNFMQRLKVVAGKAKTDKKGLAQDGATLITEVYRFRSAFDCILDAIFETAVGTTWNAVRAILAIVAQIIAWGVSNVLVAAIASAVLVALSVEDFYNDTKAAIGAIQRVFNE